MLAPQKIEPGFNIRGRSNTLSVEDDDERREAIHEALQEIGAQDIHDEENSAVLTGWVLVSEWMDEDGQRWLNKLQSPNIQTWTANGFHWEALYGVWPVPYRGLESGEDEEDEQD